jgi:hypothetical protein
MPLVEEEQTPDFFHFGVILSPNFESALIPNFLEVYEWLRVNWLLLAS